MNYNSPKEAYDFLLYQLTEYHDDREAKNILDIFYKDVMQIKQVHEVSEWSSDSQQKTFANGADRLLTGEPIQYIAGSTNFYGYDFKVNKSVLIPRPETEELVYWIVEDHKALTQQLDIIDIGCGSGCIAISIKLKMPKMRVFGVEKSLDALNVSRINARRHNVDLSLFRFDFLDSSFWHSMGKLDIIVSNPPYISVTEKDRMDESSLKFEPKEALFVDENSPLIFYRAIADFGLQALNKGGKIYVELNDIRSEETRQLFIEKGYSKAIIKKDLQGADRMLKVEL